MRAHRHARREREELLAVAARQVRDRPHDPLLPKQLVGERRDVAHVDARAHDRPSLGKRTERRRHERADRSEDDRRVELLGRLLVRPSRPLAAELEREAACVFVAGADEAEQAPALVTRDLGDDVRRHAEAVEAEPLAVARQPQRAVADQPGAEQRRRLLVGIALGDREAEALGGDGVLRVAAVEVVAGEPGRVAEVLAAAAAVAARPVRPAEPRDAEPPPVLRPSCQYVGHGGRLSEPGTYFTGRAGATPVIVTRARDDVLRAFVNVCRHRGFVVAEGEGRRETLQCPYHAWTYGLDGSLRAAPRSEEEPDFPQGELGLKAAAVDT